MPRISSIYCRTPWVPSNHRCNTHRGQGGHVPCTHQVTGDSQCFCPLRKKFYFVGLRLEFGVPYAELIKLLRLFLLFPVSSCTPERSLSALTRVKSFLWATMGQERFNSCIILNVYRELAGEVAVEGLWGELFDSDSRKWIFRNVL